MATSNRPVPEPETGDRSAVTRLLRRHPDIHDAVVLPSGEGDGLAAFLVLENPVPVGQIRGFAEAGLPDVLVPGHFMVLPEIPADEHGGHDTPTLLRLLEEHRAHQERRVEPQTHTEKYLAGVWESLLGVEDVGAGDDFFELGGHSMLAFQVENKIRRELGVALDYRTVLSTTVLADLAMAVDRARAAGADR